MIYRDKIESDYYRLFKLYKYGVTVYSPLFLGILTGKYNDGIPKDSRVANIDDPYIKKKYDEIFGEHNKPKYTKML